jgi:ribosomal protein S6
MNKIIENNMGEGTVYEFSSLFVPELDAAALSQILISIKTKITDLEGEIVSEGEPVYIKLAYEIQKSINNKIKKITFAHFSWIKFEVAPANVAKFEKFVKEDMRESVMRYLVIKTVRESTVLTRLSEALQDKADDDLIEEVLKTDVSAVIDTDATTDLGDTAVTVVEETTAAAVGEETVQK